MRSPGLPCPVSFVRLVKVPLLFSRGARPQCLTTARALAKRVRSPVWAKMIALRAGKPTIEGSSELSGQRASRG